MGGNSRKFKKAEKSKIKLKGAKLPKGTNVTKTNFKVRKIVIPEQLKQRNLSDPSVLSHRSLTAKDCLAKLKQNNPASKCDGLRGVREILGKLPTEITENNLSLAVKSIASVAVDQERDVRRDCYKTLGLLFAAAKEENILPFFDVLLSFLRCAMTHIQPRIQEDSLLLLDTYLMYLPRLVLLNRDKIFPQFLDMISKLRNESKPERTLTLSLNKQQTNTKWRTRVLMRLIGMLKILIDRKRGKKELADDGEVEAMEVEDQSNPFATKSAQISSATLKIDNVFDVKSPGHFPLIRRNLYEPCALPFLFRKTIGETRLTMSDQLDEGRKLKTYVQMLMPLLFESWLEVRPDTSGFESSDHVLSHEAATTLSLLLDIAIQLWELITIYGQETNNSDLSRWFRAEYAENFCSHILVGFPYQQSPAATKAQKQRNVSDENSERNVDEKCYQQNFNICYFYCCLSENFRADRSKNYAKVVTYVEACVNGWRFRSPELNALLLKVLRYMLLETDCATVNQNTRGLLKTLLEVYIQSKLPQDTRNRILILFCDIIVLNDRLWREYGQDIFTLWLKMLPNLLKKPSIDLSVLKALLCLAKQKNTIFLQSLEENIAEIVANAGKIKIVNEQYRNEGAVLIVNLLFWIGSKETLEKLVNGETLNELDEGMREYFRSTMRSRLACL
uniref:Pre-rRNA-processing protein Ipi1 N-terminal domain-containing protein n=1 Tax=Culex tarsalis TaxID=7177 RepID=A0A1Q3EWB4_CULTA